MKKKCKVLLLLFLILMILAMAAFLSLMIYFRSGFAPNTWINGVYCTGKSVEVVNTELLMTVEAPCITLTTESGEAYELDLKDMDYQADYQPALKRFLIEQDPLVWITQLKDSREQVLLPVTSFDREQLKERFLAIEEVREALEREKVYSLTYSEAEGYQLYDGLSHRLDVDKALELLLDAIESGEYEFSLDAPELYYDAALTKEQEDIRTLWTKIENFYQCDIIYDMGTEELALTPDILSGFLVAEGGIPVLDENGSLVLDKEAITAFIASLAEQYDTYKKEREFQSTRGDMVTIKKGTYGTLLNQTKEAAFLMDNLLSDAMHTGKPQKHVPVYKREAYVRGLNDIGGTYIEIDLTEQKLYFYEDDTLEIETDIVTGNERSKMNTPEGIYFIYAMQRNRTLRGPGYASFVKYWMPVNGGIGLHDAGWRDAFGGEIYKRNGSHGCINIPSDVMPDIYEKSEVGLPVIIIR